MPRAVAEPEVLHVDNSMWVFLLIFNTQACDNFFLFLYRSTL